MSFKIVQPIEDDEEGILNVVPEQWEKGNIFNWPLRKTYAMDRILRDCNSTPPLTGCFQMHCNVKRRNIKTYQEAVDIMEYMKENPDDEFFLKKRKHKPAKSNIISNEDLNQYLFNADTAPDYDESVSSTSEISIKLEDVETGQYTLEHSTSGNTIANPIQTCHGIMCEEMAQKIIDTFNCSLARLEAKINALTKFKAPASIPPAVLKICETADELIALDKSLSEKEELESFKTKLTNIAGQKSIDGTTVCYRLIDHIVNRNVLLEFSWTGAGKGTQKKRFSDLQRLRYAIIEIIQCNNDSNFTHADCELFFSTILKNAVQRSLKRSKHQTRRGSKRIKKLPTETVNIEPVDNDKTVDDNDKIN